MIAGSGPRNSVVSSMNLSTHCCSCSDRSCEVSSLPSRTSLSWVTVISFNLLLSQLQKVVVLNSVAEKPDGTLDGRFEPPAWFDQVGGVFGRDDGRASYDVRVPQRLCVIDGRINRLVRAGEVNLAPGDRLRSGLLSAGDNRVELDDLALDEGRDANGLHTNSGFGCLRALSVTPAEDLGEGLDQVQDIGDAVDPADVESNRGRDELVPVAHVHLEPVLHVGPVVALADQVLGALDLELLDV